VIRALIATVLMVSTAAYAVEAPTLNGTSCAALLVKLQSAFDGKIQTTDYFENPSLHPRMPSVEVRDRRKGRFGGNRLVLHRINAKWVSMYTTVTYDYQGDPRWFIETLGIEAARYFGFEMINDEEMVIPDSAEFQGALDNINRHLRIPIPVTFYTPPNNENTKVADYVRRFANEGSIPIAPSGNHLIHDLSFHTGAIFLPPNFVAMKRMTVQLLEKFALDQEAKYASQADKLKAARYYAFLLRMRETISIDLATGILTPTLVSTLRQIEHRGDSDHVTDTPLHELSNGGKPSPAYLREAIIDLKNRDLEPREWGQINRAKLAQMDKVLPLDSYLSDFNSSSYVRDFDAALWTDVAKLGIGWFSEIQKKYCPAIMARRSEIRETILNLQMSNWRIK
jgi:hypothetical protein